MIRLLDDIVINRIAAGEVVERPASVLKELLENALDAGATTLRIALRGGGAELVQVQDDGLGMDRHDALLCIERHATSKLAAFEDLDHLATHGFRGEALPSIASVSRFELQTRQRGAKVGLELRLEGGKLIGVQEVGCPEGTRVSVRDLFFSTPARRKFLRTPPTELRHCQDVVLKAALIRPDVDWEVLHDGRQLLRAPRQSGRAARAADLLGPAGEALQAVSFSSENLRVEALISPRGVHQAASQAAQHFYVNGRNVRDLLLRKAVQEAYEGLIPLGRAPSIILEVTLPPAQVDVNAHPAKTEVRFQQGHLVHALVRDGLRGALSSIAAPFREAKLPQDPRQLSILPAPGGPTLAAESAQLSFQAAPTASSKTAQVSGSLEQISPEPPTVFGTSFATGPVGSEPVQPQVGRQNRPVPTKLEESPRQAALDPSQPAPPKVATPKLPPKSGRLVAPSAAVSESHEPSGDVSPPIPVVLTPAATADPSPRAGQSRTPQPAQAPGKQPPSTADSPLEAPLSLANTGANARPFETPSLGPGSTIPTWSRRVVASPAAPNVAPRPLGLVADRYIACDHQGALFLVDQTALRVALAQLALSGAPQPEHLRMPEPLELSPPGAAPYPTSLLSDLPARCAILERLGLELEPFGEGRLLIRALPRALRGVTPSAAAHAGLRCPQSDLPTLRVALAQLVGELPSQRSLLELRELLVQLSGHPQLLPSVSRSLGPTELAALFSRSAP